MNNDVLLNIAKYERRLPINLISTNTLECYESFKNFMKTTGNGILQNIESLHLPSTGFEEKLQTILGSILKLTRLKTLVYKGRKEDNNGKIIKGDIANLPRNMQKLICLTYLDLSFNDINIFPAWILNLKNLQRLQMSFCALKEIPAEISVLSMLKEIHMKENQLSTLPESFFSLQNLNVLNLSNNKFTEIPLALFELQNLSTLDLSENLIGGCVASSKRWRNLKSLKLRNNEIVTVDADFVNSTSLNCLDLRFNKIRIVSSLLIEKDFILLDGNPIGYNSPKKEDRDLLDFYKVPAFAMENDTCCMKVEIETGAQFQLPCGIDIVVPKNACAVNIILYSQLVPDADVDFRLEDMDVLLSGVLELSPDGLTFDNPIKLSIPYSFERHDQQTREIVIRVMSADGSTEDLETQTIKENNGERNMNIAEAYTSHFCLFGVVARVMEASTILQEDSQHLLFSPAFPRTKLKFEEGSVNNGTKVTMKVINMDSTIVEEISQSQTAIASCILSVQVFPPETVFKKPVIVRLALPDKLLGKEFDHNTLKLMKCAHDSIEWQDVTHATPLNISAVDVSFQVHSFSKFVLVTEIFCGVVRYIYRRLRTHKVQFLAMQKHSLPTQVLAQCVLEKKVPERVKQLTESGYSGEDSVTPVQEIMEGAVFKMKVIGDVKLQTFKEKVAQHVQEKLVVCRFFSQYPPDKKGFSRFFIESREENKKFHTGFVSFYKVDNEEEKVTKIAARKDLPSFSPPEITKQKRKAESGDNNLVINNTSNNRKEIIEIDSGDEFDDDNHLGDIPIVLQGDGLDPTINQSRQMDLDYGGLGTGMFREDNLRYLSNHIGKEWREIGTFLDLNSAQLDRIEMNNPGNLSEQIFRMLKSWSDLHKADEDCIERFTTGLSEAGRNDLALKVKSLYEEGTKEFHNSVKSMRIG
uniref:p53-induced death domain-containing protein 1-like isoform X1 n=2 Tax=Styela clava TaxID=7725 RepID=UPI001939C52C|nr:p53-induced death domain-containing protein 1-like isoform X1 [Styela clava]